MSNLAFENHAYVMPPYVYRDNKMLTFTVKTSPEILQELVPAPLVPNADNNIVVYVGALNIVEPAGCPYDEAGIMIPVTYEGNPYTFLPVLYLDEMDPLLAGREVWGFNKIRADIYFREENGRVEAGVISENVSLIEASLDLTEELEPRPSLEREHVLLKRVPSVESINEFEIKRLTTCKVTNDVRHQVSTGKGTLSLGSTQRDPLGSIPILEIVDVTCTRGDLTLNYGRTLYDYFEQ